jgi:hypothetical protein
MVRAQPAEWVRQQRVRALGAGMGARGQRAPLASHPPPPGFLWSFPGDRRRYWNGQAVANATGFPSPQRRPRAHHALGGAYTGATATFWGNLDGVGMFAEAWVPDRVVERLQDTSSWWRQVGGWR